MDDGSNGLITMFSAVASTAFLIYCISAIRRCRNDHNLVRIHPNPRNIPSTVINGNEVESASLEKDIGSDRSGSVSRV